MEKNSANEEEKAISVAESIQNNVKISGNNILTSLKRFNSAYGKDDISMLFCVDFLNLVKEGPVMLLSSVSTPEDEAYPQLKDLEALIQQKI